MKVPLPSKGFGFKSSVAALHGGVKVGRKGRSGCFWGVLF